MAVKAIEGDILIANNNDNIQNTVEIDNIADKKVCQRFGNNVKIMSFPSPSLVIANPLPLSNSAIDAPFRPSGCALW